MNRLRGLLAAAVAFLCLAGETQADCYDASGCVETAKSADAFTESVGINTHFGYTDTPYWTDWPMIRDRLKELGVSHLRDGTFAAHYSTGPTVAARYRGTKVGLNLLTGLEQAPSGPGGSGEGLSTRLGWIKSENLTPQVIGLEGSNESWNDATVIRNMQCELWNSVKSDSVLSAKPVIGPSGGPPFAMTTWYDRVGDLSGCLDKGNLHPFPGAQPPNLHQDQDLSVAMGWGRRTYGQAPYWATETGYWNAGDDNYVSEQAASVYVPRAVLEYFRRGIERTQLYELIDTGDQNDGRAYGLLRGDGSRKPAFSALANTLAILRDTAPASGSFGFGIVCTSNCHSAIRHVLLRHSSGPYYLAAWSESRVWDKASKIDTPQPAQEIDLNLSEVPRRVDIYNTSGTAPFRTVTDGSTTIATQVTDGLRLFKVTPVTPRGNR
ncbi:MAG TPA: hypothetical protein VGR11_16510 [Solirubrobacteraceae bacterium]|nr:hypothetical protein [Solirubrobacteraceae bacterium]